MPALLLGELMSFFNRYGLINASEVEDVSENCPLFTAEYLILKEILGETDVQVELDLVKYIHALENPETNRYNNIPGILDGNDRYVSHDQYTTICAFSAAKGYDFHKKIWKEIKFGTYDNLKSGFSISGLMHPRDYIYIGYLNDNFWCKLLMPLFCIILIESFLNVTKVRPTFWERLKSGFTLEKRTMKGTDGQLLTLVRMWGIKKDKRPWILSKTWDLCLYIAKKTFTNGFRGIFETYFPNSEHPNRVLSSKINNYNI